MMELEEKAARQATIIYTSLSLGIAILFLLFTYFNGESYTSVARIGGTIWVFILSMIVTMPIVIPKVKEKIMR